MIKDMTVGKPARVLLAFSLPMLLSMAFQQLYNIADSVIAGKFIGRDALAAVGASYPVTMLFLAVAVGSSIGTSVIVSQLFGVRDNARMKSAISTAVISIMALSALLTIVGVFVCAPIMRALHTTGDIFSDSTLYLKIYVFGLPFLFVYNAATAVFTALGDSRTPLYFLIFSSVLNIALDLIFVIVFHWGVAGVAWATFIAQGISGALAIVTLSARVKKIKTDKPSRIFDANILKKITMVAVPSILQQSFISVGQLLVQGIINGFGTDTIAGYAAAIKVNSFAVSIFNTMSSALSSFTAQNVGANEDERVRQGYKSALVIIGVVCAVFMVLLLSVGKYIVGLFIDHGEGAGVIAEGQKFLFIVALGYPIVTLKVTTDGLLRGAGYMTAFMCSTFADLIVRVAMSFILAGKLGFTAVCISFPIGWAVGMVVSLVFFFSGRWKTAIKV